MPSANSSLFIDTYVDAVTLKKQVHTHKHTKMPLLQCDHVYYWHSVVTLLLSLGSCQVYSIFLSPVKATCKLLRKAIVLLNWQTALFWLVVSPCQASPHKYTTVSNLQPRSSVSKDIKMTHRNTKCHALKNMVTTLFYIHVWKRYPGPVSSCVTSDPTVSSGKAYPPEFYYDTYSALWQNRPRVYGFKLQWTQMEPNAVDRILAYRLGIRQVSVARLRFVIWMK